MKTLWSRTSWMMAVGIAVLVCASCNNHSVEQLSKNTNGEVRTSTEVFTTPEIDILWVVDNSGSMSEEQASLRENFNFFIEGLVEAKIDFQLAVITTDMSDLEESGRFQNIPDATPGGQSGAPVDISHCPTENGEPAPPLIIHSKDARYLNANGEPDIDLIKRDFGCNATTGITGNGFEMGLEAARRALSPALTDNYNAGFLRDDASLAVIFLTDENDCSDGGALNLTNGNICEWSRDQLTPVQEYVDFFASLKKDLNGDPDPNQVIMAGIIAPDDGQRYATGTRVAPSCVATNANGAVTGRGFSGYRYSELLQAFPNSYEDNICNPPFDQALEAISSIIVDRTRELCLTVEPLKCTSGADCASGSCEERGRQMLCEEFVIQLEVERPAAQGLPAGFTMTTANEAEPGECIVLRDQETLRCVLEEGEQYIVDYSSMQCMATGITIIPLRDAEANEQLTARYARQLDAPAPTISTQPLDPAQR